MFQNKHEKQNQFKKKGGISTILQKQNSDSSKNKSKYACNLCNHFFVYRQGLIRHLSAVHEKIKPFKYEICNVSFPTKGYLDVHKLTVHENIKTFKCKSFDETFKSSSSVTSHRRKVHEKNV